MTDLLKKYGPVAALAGVGVAAATGFVSIDLPPWAVESLKQWGPAAVLLAGFAWYVPRGTIPAFVKSQQDQAVALGGIKDGIQIVASGGNRQEEKLDEMLINQRITVNRLNQIEGLLLGSKISE